MNQRPSTSMLRHRRGATSHARPRSARSLRRRAARRHRHRRRSRARRPRRTPACTFFGARWPATRTRASSNAASLSKQLVDRVLAERTRQVDLIASAPSVIAAARKGGEAISRQTRAGRQARRSATLEDDVQGDALAAGRRRREAFLTDLLPEARHRRSHGDRPIRLQRGDHVAVVRLRAERRRLVADRVDQRRDDRAGDGRSGDAAHGRRAGERRSRRAAQGRRRESEVRPLGRRLGARAGQPAAARCAWISSTRSGKVIASSVAATRFKAFAGFAALVGRTKERRLHIPATPRCSTRRGDDERRPLARRRAHERSRRGARIQRRARSAARRRRS